MASNLQDTLQRIISKSGILMEKYRALMAEKELVDKENEALREANEQLMRQVQELRLENEHLRLARMISATPEQVAQNRAKISKLVRDIDKCISQLTD